MVEKLTQNAVVAAWKARAPGRRILRDHEVAGLHLVIGPSSAVWRFTFRPLGAREDGARHATQTLTIGTIQSVSLAEARLAAIEAKAKVRAGQDPARSAKAARQATIEARPAIVTLGEAAAAYEPWLAARKRSPKYLVDERRYLRLGVAAIGQERGLATLRAHHVEDMVHEAATPAIARKAFGAVSRLMAWAAARDMITGNPAATISRSARPKPPAVRTRRPSVETIRAAYVTAETIRPGKLCDAALAGTWADLVRFMLLVPCREIEAARALWVHIDLDAGLWVQPGRITKNGDAHTLPLAPAVVELLRRRHDAHGHKFPHVFPGPRSGRQANSWAKLLEAVHKASATTGWSWHDLRRAFVSELAELGHSETVLDGILNHRQSATRSGIIANYQQSALMAQRRKAMEAWAELITGDGCDKDATSKQN